MDIERGDIKRFKEFLNETSANLPKHRNGRYRQKVRKYGDYLYAQDREKFMVDLLEWKQNL